MNVTLCLRVGTLCLALPLLGAGLGSCRKKTISVDEARASLEEIASFTPTLNQEVTASEMLTLVEELIATAPLSRLVKENLVATIREEVEIEKRILTIIGFMESDKWYLDQDAMSFAITASEGWERFARERVQSERRIYREYIDEACQMLPPAGARGARDSMQRIMPIYDEYETLLAKDASRVFNSARALFVFLLRNMPTMRDSVTGPEWDSAELNDEYIRLLDEVIDRGTEFDQRLEALLVKRAELQKIAEDSIKAALTELAK